MNTEKETVRRVCKHSKDKSKKVDHYMNISKVVTNHCLQIDNVYQITATFIQKYSRINHGESLRNIMWQMELLYCLLCTVPYACAHMHMSIYMHYFAHLVTRCSQISSTQACERDFFAAELPCTTAALFLLGGVESSAMWRAMGGLGSLVTRSQCSCC